MTLPIKWIRTNHLEMGGEINLDQEGKKLLIEAGDAQKEIKQTEIKIDEANKNRIRSIIAALYRRGYDKVVIKSEKGLFSFVEINNVVDSLIGFVITHQDHKKVVIENIMSEEFEEVPSIINKFFVTIKYFNSAVIEFLESGGNKDELIELINSIMKLRDYAQRMIIVSDYEGDRCYEWYTLIFVVEKIAGNFGKFVKMRKSIKKKEIKKITAKLQEAQKLFNDIHSALIKKDIDAALKLNNKILKVKYDTYFDMEHYPVLGALKGNLYSFISKVVGVLL